MLKRHEVEILLKLWVQTGVQLASSWWPKSGLNGAESTFVWKLTAECSVAVPIAGTSRENCN